MAEVGPFKCSFPVPRPHILAPVYLGTPPVGRNVDMTRELRGLVVEVDDLGEETPVPGALVTLFYKQNGSLVDRLRAGVDGSFVFLNLIPGVGRYYVVANYPGVGGTTPNARIYDRLTAQEP